MSSAVNDHLDVGFGITAAHGAQLTVTDGVVTGVPGLAVSSADRASLILTNVSIFDTIPSSGIINGIHGAMGASAVGGRLDLIGCTISGSPNVNVFAAEGGEITLTEGCVVSNAQASELGGGRPRG